MWPLAQHMQQPVKSACTEDPTATTLLTNIYPYVLPHLSSQHLCYQLLNKWEWNCLKSHQIINILLCQTECKKKKY